MFAKKANTRLSWSTQNLATPPKNCALLQTSASSITVKFVLIDPSVQLPRSIKGTPGSTDNGRPFKISCPLNLMNCTAFEQFEGAGSRAVPRKPPIGGPGGPACRFCSGEAVLRTTAALLVVVLVLEPPSNSA